MNKLKKISILIILAVVFCGYCFRQQIVSRFKSDPGNYLLQLICMLVPLFVTFYLFLIESNQRREDNQQQEKQIKEQQANQTKIIKLLDNQNQKQKELSNDILLVSNEINKMRGPRGLSFIYKYSATLQKYVSSSDRVQSTMNIIARYTALEKINKEWASIKDDEVPLTILDIFNSAREFSKEYVILLFISWDFLIEQAESSGELKEISNIFDVGFTNCISISEMVSKGIKASQEFDQSSLEMIINKYGLKNINIKSEYELKIYMDLYGDTSQKKIEKLFINNVYQFKNNVSKISKFINEKKY